MTWYVWFLSVDEFTLINSLTFFSCASVNCWRVKFLTALTGETQLSTITLTLYSTMVLSTFHHCLNPVLFVYFQQFIFPLFQLLVCLLSDRDRFQLGTLSHSLNIKATGYQELSDWPTVAPDQSVRNVEVIEQVRKLPSWCTPHHRYNLDVPG